VKFDLVQNALDEFPVEAFGDDGFKRVVHELFKLGHVGALDVAQAGAEHQLLEIGLDAGDGRHVLPQPRIDQRPAQRRGRASHQQAGQNFQHQRRFEIAVFREHPGEVDQGLFLPGLVGIHGIEAANAPGRRKKRLAGNRRIHRHALESFEHLRQEGQVIGGRNVAVEKEARVGRRIVPPVKIAKLPVGQLRNHIGMAAGIERVNRVGIEVFLDVLVHQRIRRGVGALHFVVDDSGNDQIALDVARRRKFQMVPLLQKGFPQQAGPQHQVGIDARQIIEVRLDLAGHRIHGLVRIGKGVDEGLHRRAHQLLESVLERILFRARQDRMLQNVGQTGGILGRRAEADRVEILPLEGVQMQHFRAGLKMLDFVGDQPHGLDGGDAQHAKTVEMIAGLHRRLRNVGKCHDRNSFV